MQTLLLDAGLQPVSRLPWEKAIKMVLDRVVDVVDEYPDKYINTVSWRVNMPSVIKLVKPVHRRKALKFSRHNVYARDGGRCQYCNIRLALAKATYDHVVPRSQGGQTSWTNVVIACVPCNQQKASRTPQQAGMHLRTHPVRPKSLPDVGAPLYWQDGMPSSWASWLRDKQYWDGELEQG